MPYGYRYQYNSCTALNMAAGDASPGALVAALGGKLCCTSVATCEACCCFSYSPSRWNEEE